MIPMRIFPFLEEAALLEDTLSLCYGALAERTASEDLAGKFQQLEREESNHARIIRTGKNYELKAPDVFGDIIIDPTEIRSGSSSARAVLEDVRGGRIELRLAVSRLRNLEARFEKIHLDTLVSFNDEMLRELFRNMARDDRRHVDVLEEILNGLK
jgi:rubrerythrin